MDGPDVGGGQFDAGQIDEDLICVCCGYNLRGLDPGGLCPECGVAVKRSIQGNLLRYADPAWLARLIGGVHWMLAGTIAAVVLSLGGVFVAGIISGDTASARSDEVSGLILGASFWLGMILGLVGCWKLTSPDPGRLAAEPPWSARRATRWLPLFGLLGLTTVALAPAVIYAAVISTMVTMVWCVVLLAYLRQLAGRIPDARLLRHCRRANWGAILFLGIFPFWLCLILLLLRTQLKVAAGQARATSTNTAELPGDQTHEPAKN